MENENLIPLYGVSRQYAALRDEILTITDDVYTSGRLLDGEFTSIFENTIARRCHRKYAIAVNSCTQGLIFALQLSIPAKSKLLIPGISFVATLNSTILADHEPVICDVDRNALIDLESIDLYTEAAGTAGVMYANLFGHTVDYDRFQVQAQFFNQLIIIEDAAQSFGAKYKGKPSGSLGDVSVLSFDPTKNFNNYGSGGMVLTDNRGIAEELYDLRDNGKFLGHQGYGTNSKMSEADCAQMLVKLNYFDSWQKRRTSIANYYMSQFEDYVDVVKPGPDVESAWSKFVIRVDDRHRYVQHLADRGIECKSTYINTLGSLYGHFPNPVQLRESTAFTHECLSLPIYPELTDSEVEIVAATVKNCVR